MYDFQEVIVPYRNKLKTTKIEKSWKYIAFWKHNKQFSVIHTPDRIYI